MAFLLKLIKVNSWSQFMDDIVTTGRTLNTGASRKNIGVVGEVSKINSNESCFCNI